MLDRKLASALLDGRPEVNSMRERRRSPRYIADQEIYARIKSSIPVRIVDISARGMLVESTSAVPPVGACDLWIPGSQGDVKLRVRVQRSRAQFVATDDGSRGLVYRSGLEILEMDDSAREALASILEQLGGSLDGGEQITATVETLSDRGDADDELDFRVSSAI
jgi:hypothetical protein